MFGLTSQEKKDLERKYLGKKVRVIINDPYRYFAGTGIVEHIDDLGTIRGLWTNKDGETCSLGVCLEEDYIEILDN